MTADLLPSVRPWFEDEDSRRWVGSPEWPEGQLRLMQRPPSRTGGRGVLGWYLFVAYDGDEPVGLLNAWTLDDDSAGVTILVDPARRGRGYGRRIIEAALRMPELSQTSRVFAGVDPTNLPSVRCLQAAGFKPQSASPDEHGDIYFNRILRPDIEGAGQAEYDS